MGDERVQFISDDFVLYRGVPPEGGGCAAGVEFPSWMKWKGSTT